MPDRRPRGGAPDPQHRHDDDALALSTRSQIDACEYPDSGKILVVTGQHDEPGLRKMFRAENTVEYYDREPR